MKYSDITTNDPNPIKRFLQRSRFRTAIFLFEKYLKHVNSDEHLNILDYGAGNAELIKEIETRKIENTFHFHVYEPTRELMDEAKDNLAHLTNSRDTISFLHEIDSVKSDAIDFLFCLEVFEHLPEVETNYAIKNIKRLLHNDGTVIIGVPVEIGIPALYKGVFRMARRYGKYDACLSNVLSSVFYNPPKSRPTSEITKNFNFHYEHVGFDYRDLIGKLENKFTIIEVTSSPFKLLGSLINPECYIVLKKG